MECDKALTALTGISGRGLAGLFVVVASEVPIVIWAFIAAPL